MPYFIASDGARLFYSDQGSGLPLLCLAGLTRSGEDFDFVAPHLAGLRVIRLDYRGRGQSEWTGPATYTIPREGQDALELVDHLGLDRCAILGTSRGGLIAMGLAATAKDRLIGVALNDVGPVLSQEGLDFIGDYLGKRPAARTHADLVRTRKASLAGFANIPDSRWLAEARRHYVETAEGLELRYDPELRQAVLETGATPVPDLWPFFESLKGLPCALIRGANSNLLSADVADEMGRRLPDLIRAEVPDRGHVPFLDEPAALAALHDWIGRLQ